MSYPIMTAEEAARLVHDGDQVGLSGFTPTGCPKVAPQAIAHYVEEEYAVGRPFRIGAFTGVSTGDRLDGALACAHAIKFRTPYRSNKDPRAEINSSEAAYCDLHLSRLAQEPRAGFSSKIDVAIVEVAELMDDGQLVPTMAAGILSTIRRLADRIIVELNDRHPAKIRGLHSIAEPLDPPARREIPIYKPSDRVSKPYLQLNPKKVVAVVKTSKPNDDGGFAPLDEVTQAIGDNVMKLLEKEVCTGCTPYESLPLQSGVDNIANTVPAFVGESPKIPPSEVYTEVIQDAVTELMKEGRVKLALGYSLSTSRDVILDTYQNWDFFQDKLLLRPQEYSNNPGIAYRPGVTTMNTALEADIYGNTSSTHVFGIKMMDGIGDSGDFTRSDCIFIFTMPSATKGGAISAIVPMVSRADHTEHSVKVFITEYGIADLCGLSLRQRTKRIIENCAHPDYRPLLRVYPVQVSEGQTPVCLEKTSAFHKALAEPEDMRQAKL